MELWKQQSLAGCEGDFKRFSRVNEQLGYNKPEQVDSHRRMFDLYCNVIYQSWKTDQDFQFTKEFVNQELRALLNLYQTTPGGYRMPVEFVSILRLLWGQHSILADLEATANWHRIVYPLFSEPSLRKGVPDAVSL